MTGQRPKAIPIVPEELTFEVLLRKIQDLKDHLDKNAKNLAHAFDGL
ncbi:hypothetical protein [Streptococcus agalactiae]|nr:hypothetical protein [Streptococcus agalactiae]AKI57430.1 Hypothetical Protein GBS85147_1002 [Streptococcus agalactiae]EPW72688.1 hypothetical protein SAG0101_03095 [Streptococcus agalactiae BSU451]MCC9942603.1 hypothetical protein [Streptococcus agalactiae]HEN0438320.1 hypothetical protein [Streptococcus agalactiae]HEO1986321.1 hypothetical protein [Streptococcus agalactiae]